MSGVPDLEVDVFRRGIAVVRDGSGPLNGVLRQRGVRKVYCTARLLLYERAAAVSSKSAQLMISSPPRCTVMSGVSPPSAAIIVLRSSVPPMDTGPMDRQPPLSMTIGPVNVTFSLPA